MKKVACTPAWRRASRIWGVYWPSGPSSKVERDLALLAALSREHVGRGKCREVRRGDQLALRVEFDLPAAGLRLGGDAQHLPAPFVIQSIGKADVAQFGGLGRIERALGTEHPPERGVFAAEAPQGVAARPDRASDDHLVERRHRVEQPHLVDAVIVVGVLEAGVEGDRVEADVAFRFLGRQHRLLEGHFLGVVAALDPVVAVAADGHDQLLRRHVPLALMQHLGEPGQTGDGAGRAGRPVLVVGHQDQVVGMAGPVLRT